MQVVGYASSTDGVYVAADGEVWQESLEPGRQLSWSLGERHCAGVVTDGSHERCEDPDAPYCSAHTEPRYDPATSDATHAVYLAAFAPSLFKVGITRRERLERRLREQGADRAAHVETVRDGRLARAREEAIDETFSQLTQRVRVSQKLPGLHRSVEETGWRELLSAVEPIESFELGYGFELDEQPVVETLLSGTVRGVKGRILVIERGGTTYAVDTRQLVGYELTETADDRQLQSSLTAFD